MKTNKKIENEQKLSKIREMDLKAMQKELRIIGKEIKSRLKEQKDAEVRSAKSRG